MSIEGIDCEIACNGGADGCKGFLSVSPSEMSDDSVTAAVEAAGWIASGGLHFCSQACQERGE